MIATEEQGGKKIVSITPGYSTTPRAVAPKNVKRPRTVSTLGAVSRKAISIAVAATVAQ